MWPKLWEWRLLSTRPQSHRMVRLVRPALDPDIACASLTLIGQSPAVKRTPGRAQGTKWLVVMTMPTEGVRSLCLTWGKMCGTPGAAQIVMSEGSVRIIVRDQTFRCLRTSSVATEAARPGKLEGWHENLASEDRRSTCSMTRLVALSSFVWLCVVMSCCSQMFTEFYSSSFGTDIVLNRNI